MPTNKPVTAIEEILIQSLPSSYDRYGKSPEYIHLRDALFDFLIADPYSKEERRKHFQRCFDAFLDFTEPAGAKEEAC